MQDTVISLSRAPHQGATPPHDAQPLDTVPLDAVPLDAVPVALAVVDGHGRLAGANAAFRALLGEAASLSVVRVLDADGREADLMAEALAGRLPASGRACLWRDGAAVEGLTYACTPHGDGGFVLTLAEAVAPAEQALSEARALRAEAQLRDAIAAMEDGFVIFDAEDRFVLANRPYLDLYPGVADRFVPGARFEDILRAGLECDTFVLAPGQEPEDWLAQRMRAHREGVVGLEQRLGDGRWVAIKERRTAEGGTVGIRTDITAQKRREQTLRAAVEEARLADRVKSEFLANMSHELRTPLNAIIGFSELIMAELFGPPGDPRYAGYARDIHASGRHLLAVINDILDLSRIEAGELRLERKPLDLANLVSDSLRMVAPEAAEKGLALVNRLQAARLPMVSADAVRLRQVLLNLVSNAVKFTPPGGVVTLDYALPGDGSLRVSVADSGIGMTAQDIAIALTPFGQVQSAFSRQYQGTGLGLPIAARLLAAHGGRLELTSLPGEGTTATMVLAVEAS